MEAHNEWTLMLWARHLAREKSLKTGKYLKASTIEQRISLAKGFLSHRYGFELAGRAPRLKKFLEQARRRDPLRLQRRKRRGIRRHHLRELWSSHASVRATDRVALSEWAAETTAWHVLGRGGEMALMQRRDLQFRRCKRTGRRYAILWLQPLKKQGEQQGQKLPQFIQEQQKPEEWEPYRALRRLAAATADEPPSAPLFVGTRGRPLTTERFRALNKRYARLLGWDPKQAGAHTPRIGGAAEYVATGEASELLLQARGRWSSDIARVYARMTRRAHLAASDLMFQARGRDLEELIPEFAEPA